jgi:hypothetical protein
MMMATVTAMAAETAMVIAAVTVMVAETAIATGNNGYRDSNADLMRIRMRDPDFYLMRKCFRIHNMHCSSDKSVRVAETAMVMEALK